MRARARAPDQLYELQSKLLEYKVFYGTEVDEFAKIFYKPKEKQTQKDHAEMNACLDPAVNRFKQLGEKQEEFRKTLVSYKNLYAFLSQIIPFQDTDLEKLYSYLRFLLIKLPKRTGPLYNFDDEVTLQYYRLQKISEGSIILDKGEEATISGPTSVGTSVVIRGKIALSRLINILNERFGTSFKLGDQLFFDSILEDALADPDLQLTALANPIENFSFSFKRAIEGLFIDRMDANEEITAKFLNEEEFRDVIIQNMMKQVYKQIRSKGEK